MAGRSTGPTTFRSGLKLGLFAVVTTIALALLTDALGGITLPGRSSYTAMFTDSTGLIPGDEVRIAGAKVGEVDTIELRQGDTNVAEVTFSLEEDRTIPASVNATIKYRNLIGQRYIDLTQAAEGDEVSDKKLTPGDVIGLRQTEPALDLTVLLNGFKPLFTALSPEEVNKLSYEIIQTMQGEGSTVESLLAHTASLTQTLADRDETISSVIDNLNKVLETVASREDQLDTSITRLQEFVSGLSEDSEALGSAVASIGTLNTQTAQLVKDARPALDADVKALDVLSQTLNANSETIETTLANLPETYSQLTTTASYGSWFNFFLCDFDASIGVTPDTTINPAAVHSPLERCQAKGGDE